MTHKNDAAVWRLSPNNSTTLDPYWDADVGILVFVIQLRKALHVMEA